MGAIILLNGLLNEISFFSRCCCCCRCRLNKEENSEEDEEQDEEEEGEDNEEAVRRSDEELKDGFKEGSGGKGGKLSGAMEDLKLGASASSLKSGHSHLSRQRSGSGDNRSSAVPLIRCDSFSEEDDKFRLDADYIQRYLGELSPLEESQLIQLRTWLHHLQRGNVRNLLPETPHIFFLRCWEKS